MNGKHFSLILVLLFPIISVMATQGENLIAFGWVNDAETGEGIQNVSIFLEETKDLQVSNADGSFRFEQLQNGRYHFTFFAEGYQTHFQEIFIEGSQNYELQVSMESLALDLEAVEIEASQRATAYGVRSLRNVEGVAIYAAKKSEVIELNDKLVANLATNNARQIYKGVAGLNIWENDGAGLQLSIGARGLDPNRTSNFNTRQNGYDISADALGYPESYYTPPSQALKRIEIVRGAASLQYGPQFGGLLNFVFKDGNPKKALEVVSENTVGSWGLFSSFNSIGGSKNGWNYYGFVQRKQGNGWRPNSKFHQNTAYASISKKINQQLKIGVQYTYMDYLAQQAGGLQDFEFNQDPQQSKRARNWFKVNWNLAALTVDYRLSDKTKINSRSFLLAAQRQSLGELGPINRPDPLRERDLIRGRYHNFGNETRLLHSYQIKESLATFLIGARYYQGHAQNQQGLADDGSEANFKFLNPSNLERSDYTFPSRNISLFAENLVNITPKWSVTPGIRFEYIRTASKGFYREQVLSGGQVIYDEKINDQQKNGRSLALIGLGSAYKLSNDLEVYANFSQNYRSINFTDLAVVNPNLLVDSLLKDERGYNADMGIRGSYQNKIRFDASLFYLRYKNRIGTSEIVIPDPILVEKLTAFRTNIGDARVLGLEAFAEVNICSFFKDEEQTEGKDWSCSIFSNVSLIRGKYLAGESFFEGKEVELIPPLTIKTGATVGYKNLKAAYQFAHVAQHYSDATNALQVADATRGIIPSYSVHDLSFSYTISRFKLQAGINNLSNAHYFTRRATSYPGPGIIPADGRSFYGVFGVRF